ncbi:MAG: peptidoglycan DD-metalloendopeptidase family protein, partial [Actinobacteria bacterium]|nr:peptidoglycan DD-metalloendopeptidase family protein [Actinomycetota bacterium]
IAVFVTIIIALSSFNLISTASPKFIYSQSLEDELEQIQKEREETQEKIKEVRKQEQQYINQVEEVEGQLRSALSELDNLNTKLSEAKSEVDKATIELVLKEEELKRIEEELKEKIRILNDRVAAIYKNGNSNILEILLKAEDFLDFISKLKLMNLFAEQDTQNILEVKEKKTATIGIKKSIIDLREKQKEHEDKVKQLVGQAEQEKREIEDIYNEKENLLSRTTANKNALIQMEKQLEIKEAEVTRILESYKYGSAPSGKFAWPVAGRIQSGFGNRYHPIFGYNRFHSGIDIAAPYGTLVKAADGGQVVQSGYFGGYGYSVMLYHGGGFATWYAHLSSINVSIGQSVQRGQVIGLVGSTGWTTGPHLHFEVRINGAAQDPRAYLQ